MYGPCYVCLLCVHFEFEVGWPITNDFDTGLGGGGVPWDGSGPRYVNGVFISRYDILCVCSCRMTTGWSLDYVLPDL
jgi:hypothetical protein